jgi:hypothetical protein
MGKHRVLLVCMQPLLCEGIRRIFQVLDDVQLIYLDGADLESIEPCLQDFAPGTVLIAGERADEASTYLISHILNHWPELPVVWIELETNLIRVFTSHTLPATSQYLIGAIRQASLDSGEDQAGAKSHRRK